MHDNSFIIIIIFCLFVVNFQMNGCSVKKYVGNLFGLIADERGHLDVCVIDACDRRIQIKNGQKLDYSSLCPG